jgi:regulator of protease activity HflC (stomatin/prohibitin superfamily)
MSIFKNNPQTASGPTGPAAFLATVAKVIGLGLLGLIVLGGTVGIIGTGNVGIRTTFGIISPDEVPPGIYLKWPFISTVDEFTAKEVAIDLNDLTPKAKDNLSLRDLDVSVFYHATESTVADLQIRYAGQSARSDEDYWLPAYHLVSRVARNVVYEEVARVDSLIMHARRDDLAIAIRSNIQKELDAHDKGVFRVSRVVIRAVTTDPSIEKTIQDAVANQKRLEAMMVQTEIAKKEAEIEITRARGIAEAQRIIANTLTREYLQHEANQALRLFAEKGQAHTVVVPASMGAAPLINVPAPTPVKK